MIPSIIQQHGFSWVSLPRENITPLMLLEKESDNIFKRINQAIFKDKEAANVKNGDIFSIFPKSIRGLNPVIGIPSKCAFYKGNDIFDNSAGVDLKLQNIVTGNNGSEFNSQLQFSSKLLFSFQNVIHRSIQDEILLEEHLNITEPSISSKVLLDKLQKGSFFVITDILQTTNFSVEDAADFNLANDISLDALEQYVKIKTENQKESNNKMHYEGNTPVTFAVKACKILYYPSKGYSLSKSALKIVRDSTTRPDFDVFSSENGVIDLDF